MKTGDSIKIKIEKLVFGGEGLGYYDGFTFFVPMSVPGDEVEAEIISLKKSEIFTTINNITNWDNYFTETKTQLEEELQNLKVELNN